MRERTLTSKNKEEVKHFFDDVLNIGIDFKTKTRVSDSYFSIEENQQNIIKPLDSTGLTLEGVLEDFKTNILPFCTNFSSENFMGFPDAGNSIAALGGAMLKDFLQQNLINQSFCAPSATFVEIAVIRWLRETIGYQNKESDNLKNIFGVGGIITSGGTGSNAIGMMLARENRYPGTMESGMYNPENCCIFVPKGIGHYSVKSGAMWAGCGNNLIEVETKDFRYDLEDLKNKLGQYEGRVMAVVAYAGDSRTMTVDNLKEVYRIVKSYNQNIWLHADACHGFSLGFSQDLRYKISGIELFDSVTLDPHKVMLTPYTISALLVKNPEDFKKVISLSDLIMQEDYAFGQITPFIGSKSWESLKLWFMMKHYGKDGLDNLITTRHNLAKYLEGKLNKDSDFIVINKVEINAVAFMFKPKSKIINTSQINEINKKIHSQILQEGKYHLHQFSIPDDGKIEKGIIVYPLRFMSGNPNTTEVHIDAMIEYIRNLGHKLII